MAEVVNLKLRRKQAARAAARQQGAENAAKSGRSRAEKAQQATAAERARAELDAHRRDNGD